MNTRMLHEQCYLQPSYRQLRMNIRNAYCFSTVPELQWVRRLRIQADRSPFEIACFDELIEEAKEELK